jgi:ribonuclease HI
LVLLLIELFTDGSYDQNAQVGGWAYVAYRDGVEIHHHGESADGASNNRFEVLAVLSAATWVANLYPSSGAVIWTDSYYVMEGVRRLLPIWRNNGWRKIDPNPRHRRRPSPDRDIWQQLDCVLSNRPDIVIDWCKAHQGLVGNDRADCLAGVSRLSHAAVKSARPQPALT